MDIVAALAADDGICCTVGAGGKKTTLYTLANRIERAVVTATVRIPPYESAVSTFAVADEPARAIAATTDWPLGVVPSRDGPDRFAGYDTAAIDGLADAPVDTILVKADGARMRQFKAPHQDEPKIPSSADTVIPVVSAHVVGEPLDEAVVHRVDRVAEIAGIARGEEITPDVVGRVVASDRGGMKDVPPEAQAIPLVNMVDDRTYHERAEAVASSILDRVDVPRVVLATMREPDPLVAVVR